MGEKEKIRVAEKKTYDSMVKLTYEGFISDDVLDRFQLLKKDRIEAIKRELKRRGETELRRFLAEASVLHGIRKEIVHAYLKDLEILGFIKIEDGKVVWIAG